MPRRKVTEDQDAPLLAGLVVRKSHDEHREGDYVVLEVTERVAHLVASGYFDLIMFLEMP